VDIGGTVRARLKYVVPAGAFAAVVYVFVGGSATTRATPPALDATASGIGLVLVPLTIVAMLLARRHLVEALLAGIALTLLVALPFGLIRPSQLLHVEPGSFAARSLIIDGLERGIGVSVFTLLLAGLVSGLEASGTLERLVGRASTTASRPARAETRIVGIVMAAALVTTHSVVAMLAVGDYARRAGEAAGISGYRRANLLDLSVCTWPFLLPYFLPTILMSGATTSGSAAGLPRVSALDAGLWNVYSWALLVMLAVAVIGGYGRRE
jgi:Na+/H+ antiporter NhaC